jgi:hypothetical protein
MQAKVDGDMKKTTRHDSQLTTLSICLFHIVGMAGASFGEMRLKLEPATSSDCYARNQAIRIRMPRK